MFNSLVGLVDIDKYILSFLNPIDCTKLSTQCRYLNRIVEEKYRKEIDVKFRNANKYRSSIYSSVIYYRLLDKYVNLLLIEYRHNIKSLDDLSNYIIPRLTGYATYPTGEQVWTTYCPAKMTFDILRWLKGEYRMRYGFSTAIEMVSYGLNDMVRLFIDKESLNKCKLGVYYRNYSHSRLIINAAQRSDIRTLKYLYSLQLVNDEQWAQCILNAVMKGNGTSDLFKYIDEKGIKVTDEQVEVLVKIEFINIETLDWLRRSDKLTKEHIYKILFYGIRWVTKLVKGEYISDQEIIDFMNRRLTCNPLNARKSYEYSVIKMLEARRIFILARR